MEYSGFHFFENLECNIKAKNQISLDPDIYFTEVKLNIQSSNTTAGAATFPPHG